MRTGGVLSRLTLKVGSSSYRPTSEIIEDTDLTILLLPSRRSRGLLDIDPLEC